MRFWIMGLAALSLCLRLGAQEPSPPSKTTSPSTVVVGEAPDTPPADTPGRERSRSKLSFKQAYTGDLLKIDLDKQEMELSVAKEDGSTEAKRLRLDAKTRLLSRQAPMALQDLKPGMRIRAFYAPAEDDKPPVAIRIVINPPETIHAETQPGGTGN